MNCTSICYKKKDANIGEKTLWCGIESNNTVIDTGTDNRENKRHWETHNRFGKIIGIDSIETGSDFIVNDR